MTMYKYSSYRRIDASSSLIIPRKAWVNLKMCWLLIRWQPIGAMLQDGMIRGGKRCVKVADLVKIVSIWEAFFSFYNSSAWFLCLWMYTFATILHRVLSNNIIDLRDHAQTKCLHSKCASFAFQLCPIWTVCTEDVVWGWSRRSARWSWTLGTSKETSYSSSPGRPWGLEPWSCTFPFKQGSWNGLDHFLTMQVANLALFEACDHMDFVFISLVLQYSSDSKGSKFIFQAQMPIYRSPKNCFTRVPRRW